MKAADTSNSIKNQTSYKVCGHKHRHPPDFIVFKLQPRHAALRRMTQAFGGVPNLAEQTDLNATTLYRTLSPQGNPEMKTLTAILEALGAWAAEGVEAKIGPSEDSF